MDADGRRAAKRPKSHFGDIMGMEEGPRSSSVQLSAFAPLHRLVLTANGNLQRLVSSYHNSSVAVRQVYSRAVADGRFERQAALVCFDVDFAVATSKLKITRADCVEAITTGGVAIGQLFRHLNILPSFDLVAAGYEPGGEHFWRDYVLSGEGITCEINERVRSDVFALQPPPGASASGAAAGAAAATALPPDHGAILVEGACLTPTAHAAVLSGAVPSFGDIMSPHMTGFSLPDGFSPLQRVLLTANGNVERIVSSFYYEPVTAIVPLNHRRDACVYDRQVTMLVRGAPFLHAKSTIFVTDPAWEALVQAGTPLGALFRLHSELPTFHLRSVGRSAGRASEDSAAGSAAGSAGSRQQAEQPAERARARASAPPEACGASDGAAEGRGGFFWRVYTLASRGMTCEITETFDDDTFAKPARAGSLSSLEASDGYGLPA